MTERFHVIVSIDTGDVHEYELSAADAVDAVHAVAHRLRDEPGRITHVVARHVNGS